MTFPVWFTASAAGLLSALAFILTVPGDALSQTDKVHRVVLLPFPTAEGQAYVPTFRAAMRELGFVEGRNLTIDVRLVDRDMAGVPAVIDEVIRNNPDALVGWESVAQVMRSKTTSIPIVLAGAVDPVGAGLAHSLRHPGLNVTGVVQLNDVLPAKHIEIMRQIRPVLTRVGQLVDTTASGCKLVEQQSRQAAASMGAVMVPYYVTNRADIERAFGQMAKEKPDVLLPCPSAMMFNYRDVLFENVLRLGIPLTSFVPANVPVGVLFAYATSLHDTYKRAAVYVGKILRGAKAADLPIEQPTTFTMVINLKTARALGITVPSSILLRADRVIE